MGRKDFLADLAIASKVADYGNITTIRSGEESGSFTFVFRHPTTGLKSALMADVETSEYPKTHVYTLCADDSACPKVASCLDDCRSLSGKCIQDALPLLSSYLTEKTATGGQLDPFSIDSDINMDDFSSYHGDDPIEQNEEEQEEEDPDDDYDDIEADNYFLEADDFTDAVGSHYRRTSKLGDRLDVSETLIRARADLRAVKDAGFKVGLTGPLSAEASFYVSISCRISKLGISDEAQDAWTVHDNDYIVLLIHFPHGYRSLDHIQSLGSKAAHERMNTRIGLCDYYKPRSLAEAQAAFNPTPDAHVNPDSETQVDGNDIEPDQTVGFRPTFISQPLNSLLNERFATLLKYRLAMNVSWTGAQKFYTDTLATMNISGSRIDDKAFDPALDLPTAIGTLPAIVTQDQIFSDGPTANKLSLPLLAMQFTLRHFVRCTEFCLVCFSKLNSDVEAIKPYVCDSPLCLYQYMSLGFGPSVEHEIIAQPYVVDLLVSFCYSAATACNLHEYPEGLGLMVPNPKLPLQGVTVATPSGHPHYHHMPHGAPAASTVEAKDDTTGKQISATLEGATLELVIQEEDQHQASWSAGQWLVLNPSSQCTQSWHCCVVDKTRFPRIQVSPPIIVDGTMPVWADTGKVSYHVPEKFTEVRLHKYDHNINDLNKNDMSTIILLLLDSLPTVQEMRSRLMRHPGSLLSDWTKRITPASLSILRWIIASNRSCIMQVDQLEGDSITRRKPEARIPDFPNYMQFRFAMGAPDKEQRFIDSIKAESSQNPYPTIFAWHGSPNHNWHSILRQGLHAQKVSHGRAYGNGVYHAKDMNTSMGYAGMSAVNSWPQSQIGFTNAIALSEIVNAPSKFASSNPYYVVPQLEWIQTRYLFVAIRGSAKIVQTQFDGETLQQDPLHTPRGASNRPLVLPLSTIPKSRRNQLLQTTGGGQAVAPVSASSKRPVTPSAPSGPAVIKRRAIRQTMDGSSSTAAIVIDEKDEAGDDDDTASVQTEVEDLEQLFEPEEAPPPAEHKTKLPAEPLTPFVIKRLGRLPLTYPPDFATAHASKRLIKDYHILLRTQEQHIKDGTLWELGWYIDPDFMEEKANLYQWIVELHSFPLSIPLGKDMKAHDVQSVVLEIRFGQDYPNSPPFIRVIRPRFLPFAEGGGGHITAGGSICTELLTTDGWLPTYALSSVLYQLRLAMMSQEPKPARLHYATRRSAGALADYSTEEAVQAFRRAAAVHGWKVPTGLDSTARSTLRMERMEVDEDGEDDSS